MLPHEPARYQVTRRCLTAPWERMATACVPSIPMRSPEDSPDEFNVFAFDITR